MGTDKIVYVAWMFGRKNPLAGKEFLCDAVYSCATRCEA